MKCTPLIASIIAPILIVLASHVFAQDSCYPHDVAYVERLTVIRERPGLYGRAIGAAKRAARYRVLDSKRVRRDCWAQVPVGWLLTDNLTAEPVPTPRPPTQSPVNLPRIKGDAEFVAQIAEGLAYLREKAPRWYRYVTQYRYTIEPCGPCPDRSLAQWPDKRVYIHEDTFVSPMRLARVLVHESCHIHQGVQGRWPTSEDGKYAAVHVEQECVSRELEMVLDIDPEHSYIDELGSKLAQPYKWWAADALLPPPGPV